MRIAINGQLWRSIRPHRRAITKAGTPGRWRIRIVSVGHQVKWEAATPPFIKRGAIEPVSGATVSANYLKDARDAIANAHGRALRTVNGRVIAIEGNAPAKVAIVEWDSADEAVAFYKSEAWKKLTPEREKTQKTLRRYVVETEQ